VILPTHNSTAVRCWKAAPKDLAPTAISTAKANTGNAVPAPYKDGSTTLNRHLMDNGIRLPKKSAPRSDRRRRQTAFLTVLHASHGLRQSIADV
jgi:hypothetical protein